MQRSKAILTGATVLVLAATLWPAAATAQTLIVAFGDSNTYGMNMAREQSYPAQLEAMLRAKGHNVRVENAGVPGNTTADGLARVNSAVPAGARIAIVTFGVNDARKGVSPASIEQNLSAIVSNLKSRNVRVVLCGRKAPFPPGYDKGAYFGVYQRLVKQNGIAGCVFHKDIPPSGFAADGHENAAGNTVVAKNMMQIVERMLGGGKK